MFYTRNFKKLNLKNLYIAVIIQPNYFSGFKIMNPISLSLNFARILLLSTALVFVVALLVLRMFVSVLASENFLSKSLLSTLVAPRLKTKALLLMSVDCCERAEKALEFTANGFVEMDLQKRAQEASLSGLVDNMSPTAIFNRFDLSSSSGQHCGEYRVVKTIGF
jgi:hypothetical protein